MPTPSTLFNVLKLLLLFAACYAAGAALFAPRGARHAPMLGIVCTLAGLCLITLASLLGKLTGAAAVCYVAAFALVAATHWFRRPALCAWPATPGFATACAFVLCVIVALPVFIMGWRMGSGDFPAEFFAVDSPFLLQQVYALLRSDGYPPPSLELYGFSFNYHYGMQAFVALASALSGLAPHFVMFAVIEPLLVLLAAFVVFDIARLLTGSARTALLCLCIVLLGSKQYLINYLDPSWWRFVTRVENYNFRFPNLPDVAGMLLALCTVRCALEFEQRTLRLAALFFVCMMPVFKIPYVVPVSTGMALIYAIELKRQFRPALLVEISATAMLSSAVYWVFARSDVTTGGAANFQIPGFAGMSMPWDNQTLLVMSVLLAATTAITRYRCDARTSRLLQFALAPYVLFFAWRLNIDNGYQIFNLASAIFVLFAASYLTQAWSNRPLLSRPLKWLCFTAVFALIFPATISLANHIYVVSAEPQRGHEYADNRQVADALAHVPLENSLLITNDLRYPANRYIRDNRQLQLAGIYGHRNFATNLEYGGVRREDAVHYAQLVALFRLRQWPGEQISLFREKVGLTHLLIHKTYAHADNIPLNLEYENDEYAVYRF